MHREIRATEFLPLRMQGNDICVYPCSSVVPYLFQQPVEYGIETGALLSRFFVSGDGFFYSLHCLAYGAVANPEKFP